MHPPRAEPALPQEAAAPRLAPEALDSFDERAAWALVLAAWLQAPEPNEQPQPLPEPQPEAAAEGVLAWHAPPPASTDWWL
jgi:hypothetical protein